MRLRAHTKRLIIVLVIVSSFFCSCKKNKSFTDYYYTGNKTIEIVIPGDTLGILFKDPPSDPTKNFNASFINFKNQADTTLKKQGFKSAGYITTNVELLISPYKTNSIASLEKRARQLKDSNTNFVAYSGYMARIKETNEPILITDRINITFRAGTSDTQINNLFQQYHLKIAIKNPFVPLQYTVAVTENSPYHALKMSHKLKGKPIVKSANIDIIYRKDFDNVEPTDGYFQNQWHLLNTGVNSGATEDADIDADLAWDYSMGDKNTIIAVIDGGFDANHDDLKDNFSHNLNEIPWNNTDDDDFDHDPSTYIDDTTGWNFLDNSNRLDGDNHGTAVTGVAAADVNGFGVAGSCPKCNILPLRTLSGSLESLDILAVYYARRRGAKIINLSWHPRVDLPDLKTAISDVITSGLVVICSMSNDPKSSCESFSFTNMPGTIAVSRANRYDKYDNSGKGDCLDLLAPSAKQRTSDADIHGITTTDVMGDGGYANGSTDWGYRAIYENDKDYSASFWGTSASVPLTAGVAGLILSADPTLNPQQVRYLLQDCADKIEPGMAAYDKYGFSRPAGGSTHGFGRLNAFEAVRIASPIDNGTNKPGLAGMDPFFRDNDLDWGNTEQPSSTKFESPREFIPFWTSQDIKVDAPPFETGIASDPLINTNSEFEHLGNDNIAGGTMNRVYVRIRNRGYNKIPSVNIKLHWTDACLGFPALPTDFWDRFPADASDVSVWHPIAVKTVSNLKYSGCSVAGTSDDDGSQIVMLEFNAPFHDESKPVNHYCLMAIASCDNDAMPTNELKTNANRLNMDYVTKNFNNATHRNYIIINPPVAQFPIPESFYIYNPFTYPIITKIETGSSKRISFKEETIVPGKEFMLKKGEKRMVTINIMPGKVRKAEEVIIKQMLILANKKEEVMGGLTILINPPKQN